MSTLRAVLRLIGRITIASIVLVVLAFVGVQFAHLIDKNVALARELDTVTSDVAALNAKRVHQAATIKRVTDPLGAIPEIHDLLRLATAKEAIVYLKKAPPVGP